MAYALLIVAKAQLTHADSAHEELSTAADRCREKFLRFFPAGFKDPKYEEWERGYKWNAHQRWNEELNREEFRSLLIAGQYVEISERAVRIESRTNLLFSFEKMAIRDAVKSIAGACSFATGLYYFLHGAKSDEERFNDWCKALKTLPQKKTRVVTWPIATVFAFIALPSKHIFLKPTVTRAAAKQYDFRFKYEPRLTWKTYESLVKFAERIDLDLRDLGPRDMIDIQSFIWLQGSDEYQE